MTRYLRTTTVPHETRRHPGWRIPGEDGQPGRLLTDDELAERGWLPIVDEPPEYDPDTEYLVRKPMDEWEIVGEGAERRAHVGYTVTAYTAGELLDRARAAALSTIEQRLVAEMAAGAPYGELHIALHDGSRADLSGMAATALAAAAEQVPWPDDYALGWISVENARIPLPTPADGLALAAAVGQRYAALRQAGRTLKDAVLAAEDAAAVAAIDLEAGWPE